MHINFSVSGKIQIKINKHFTAGFFRTSPAF
jgi:hypothetical protein